MRRLIDAYGLREPIAAMARAGAPMLGTCAGMILLAQRHRPTARSRSSACSTSRCAATATAASSTASRPISTRRSSARSRCTASSSARRWSSGVGPDAEVLARDPDGNPVAVRQGRVLATAFHPELTGDRRMHRLLVEMIGEGREASGVIEVERTIRSRAPDRPPGAGRPVAHASTRPPTRTGAAWACRRRRASRAAHQPLDPDPVVAAAARAIGPSRGRGRRGDRRQLPRHRGAAPRRLGHHRARRGRRADGGRDPLRPARRAGRGGRAPRRRALPRRVRRRAREPRAVRAVRLHGLRPGGDLVAAAGAAARPALVAAIAGRPRRAQRRPRRRRGRPARLQAGRRAGRVAPVRPVVARHAAGDRAHRGLRRGRLGVGRPRGDRAALGAQPAPALRPRSRPGSCRPSSAPEGSPSTAPAAPGRTTCASWSATAWTARASCGGARTHRRATRSAAGILSPVRTYESAGMRAAEESASSRSGASRSSCARSARRYASRRWFRRSGEATQGRSNERGTTRDDRRPRCPHGGAAAGDRRAAERPREPDRPARGGDGPRPPAARRASRPARRTCSTARSPRPTSTTSSTTSASSATTTAPASSARCTASPPSATDRARSSG